MTATILVCCASAVVVSLSAHLQMAIRPGANGALSSVAAALTAPQTLTSGLPRTRMAN